MKTKCFDIINNNIQKFIKYNNNSLKTKAYKFQLIMAGKIQTKHKNNYTILEIIVPISQIVFFFFLN